MIEDIDALRTRFRANLESIGLKSDQVVMLNQPGANVDEKKPWGIFLINPGAAEEQGFDTYVRVFQTGYVMLQIFVPNGQGSKVAYEIAEAFRKIWFKWRERSETGHILTKVGYPRQIANKDFMQVNVFVPYDSVRLMPL